MARKDTWLKVASGIWILSALGAAIALTKGVHIADVIESVGALWILLAMLCGKRIAVLFPNHRTEIAFGLAMMATALGIGSVFYYSTKHVAITASARYRIICIDAGIHCLSIHYYDLVSFSVGRAVRDAATIAPPKNLASPPGYFGSLAARP